MPDFWMMRRSDSTVCRHFDDLDAEPESDTFDDFRQLWGHKMNDEQGVTPGN